MCTFLDFCHSWLCVPQLRYVFSLLLLFSQLAYCVLSVMQSVIFFKNTYFASSKSPELGNFLSREAQLHFL